MPRPEDVNPHRFKVKTIVYNDKNEKFSVAWGTWEGEHDRLGVRWDGNDDAPGYPNQGGHPVWFIWPPALTKPLATALLLLPGTHREKLLRVMTEILGADQ